MGGVAKEIHHDENAPIAQLVDGNVSRTHTVQVRILLGVPIFMKQPIFAIKKSKVKEIIEHQSKFTQIPYGLEWGHLNSIEELFEKLDNEKTEFECIRMHRVYDCIYSFETHKIPAYANRMLDRVFALCKIYREDLNKISVEQQ